MTSRLRTWCATSTVLIVVLVPACGGDDPASINTEASTESSLPISTSAPPTTATAPATTTGPTTESTAPCEFVGTQTEQRFDFPNLMTSLVGADIRTGLHGCFERIVIELQPGDAPTPGGMPGWLVRYTDEPITLGQTDDQFVELDGDADLLITMNAWMVGFDENGYDGPTDIRPTNTKVIRELRLIDDFEGQHTWAIGLDARRDVRVFTLSGPDRLVVDIATT